MDKTGSQNSAQGLEDQVIEDPDTDAVQSESSELETQEASSGQERSEEVTIDPAAPKECLICFEDVQPGARGRLDPCGHEFHKACASTWAQNSQSCSYCRTDAANIQFNFNEDGTEFETEMVEPPAMTVEFTVAQIAQGIAIYTLAPLPFYEIVSEDRTVVLVDGVRSTPIEAGVPLRILNATPEMSIQDGANNYSLVGPLQELRDAQGPETNGMLDILRDMIQMANALDEGSSLIGRNHNLSAMIGEEDDDGEDFALWQPPPAAMRPPRRRRQTRSQQVAAATSEPLGRRRRRQVDFGADEADDDQDEERGPFPTWRRRGRPALPRVAGNRVVALPGRRSQRVISLGGQQSPDQTEQSTPNRRRRRDTRSTSQSTNGPTPSRRRRANRRESPTRRRGQRKR